MGGLKRDYALRGIGWRERICRSSVCFWMKWQASRLEKVLDPKDRFELPLQSRAVTNRVDTSGKTQDVRLMGNQ